MTINYRFVLDTNELDDNEVGLGAPFVDVERFVLDGSPLNDVGFGLGGEDASFLVLGSADTEMGGLVAQASGEIIITVVAVGEAQLGELDAQASATITHNATVQSALGGLVAQSSATVIHSAIGESNLGGLSALAIANIDNPATGEAGLGETTANVSATITHNAQAASQFQAITASGSAIVVINASGATLIPALVASADGTVIPVGEGIADAPLGSLDVSASASVVSRGGGGGGIRWLQELPPKQIVVAQDVVEETEVIVVEREPVFVFATASARLPVLRVRAVGSVAWVAERDDEEVLLLV